MVVVSLHEQEDLPVAPEEPAVGDPLHGEDVVARPPQPTEPESHIYQKWWFWTGVAVVGVAGGIGIYEGTKSNPPDTTFGLLVFGK